MKDKIVLVVPCKQYGVQFACQYSFEIFLSVAFSINSNSGINPQSSILVKNGSCLLVEAGSILKERVAEMEQKLHRQEADLDSHIKAITSLESEKLDLIEGINFLLS